MTDTDAATAVAQVLKRDARGRVKTLPAQREALLDEFERSGLSGPAFARVAGINYQTFATWRHQRKQRRMTAGGTTLSASDASRSNVRLLEAVMEQPQPTSRAHCVAALCITLPGGSSLQLTNADQAPLAAQLIKALASDLSC